MTNINSIRLPFAIAIAIALILDSAIAYANIVATTTGITIAIAQRFIDNITITYAIPKI